MSALQKLTPKQVEDNMDLGVSQETLQILRDYVMEKFPLEMQIIHDNIADIVRHIEGTAASAMAIPTVFPPGDADPTGTTDNPVKKGSFYFNVSNKEFRSYNGSAWTVMASLTQIVELSDYMKTQDLYDTFVEGSAATLDQVYDLEEGKDVVDKNVLFLNLTEQVKLLKHQREIDKNFLAEFKDELTYVSSNKIAYKDTTLNMETLSASVQTNGNAVTYTTLIHPYDRINQEQASFEAAFEVEASVEYLFNTKFKALRFSGTAGQKYKWETIGKSEGDVRVPYIRFTGTAKMETTTNPLSNTSWVTHPLPYEIKLSDLMDGTSEATRTAIVTFKFPTLPAFGTHFMTIDYLTTNQYFESRMANLIRTLKLTLDKVTGDKSVYSYPMIGDSFTLNLQYPHGDKPSQMKVGDEITMEIDSSKIPAGVTDQTTVLMQDQSKVVSDPAANQATFEFFQSQANANQNDKDLFTYARRWSYFKDMVDKYYLVLTKGEDFDGKTIWIPTGWTAKPAPEVEEAKNYFKEYAKNINVITLTEDVPEGMYDISIEWKHPTTNLPIAFLTSTVEAKAGSRAIISKAIKLPSNIASIVGGGATDGPDGPVYYGSYNATLEFIVGGKAGTIGSFELKDIEFFDPYAGAVSTININGADKRVIMSGGDGNILNMFKNTFIVKFISKAGSFVKNTDIQVDPALGWVNVGHGHGKQVAAFDDAGRLKFRDYFGKDDAALLFEAKTYDYSNSQSTVNLNVTGGKRYLIITQHADAPNTPVGAVNKIWLAHPATPQDNDQVTYGTDLIWIVKKDGNIMQWVEIKDHVLKDDKMVIKHLDNGNWEFQAWEVNAKSTNIPFFGEFKTEALLRLATGMNADDLAFTEDENIWWHYTGAEWVHHIDSGGGGGTPGATLVHVEATRIYIGKDAGKTNQGLYGIAIGNGAGMENQAPRTMAFGTNAGWKNQKDYAMAFGISAGRENQGANGLAIGHGAALTSQGENAIAMGQDAGKTNQPAKSIVINANNVEATPSAENEILIVAGTTTLKIDGTGIYLNGVKVVNPGGIV